MKYFKQEYLDYDYKNEKIRSEMNLKWEKACTAYSIYFETIKTLFSKKFIELYDKYDGFHDIPINRITIENKNMQHCDIGIFLQINESEYVLVYKNVVSYQFHVPRDHNWFFNTMCWGYGEFELLHDGKLNHKILCLDNCEFDITFKKIFIKKSVL